MSVSKHLEELLGDLKEGDILLCTRSASPYFTEGKQYIAQRRKNLQALLCVLDDDGFEMWLSISLFQLYCRAGDPLFYGDYSPANSAAAAAASESVAASLSEALSSDVQAAVAKADAAKGPISSDGGPSDYYDFLPNWRTWNDFADYKATMQWKEYSFHLGNIGKVLCRWGDKDGTSLEYDARKIVYSGLRILLMLLGKEQTKEYIGRLLVDPQFN